MKEQLKVTFALIIAMLFWGISFIWSEQALAVYDPFTLVLFRLIISTSLLFGINIWLKKIRRIDKKDIFRFTLLAFLQPFAYFIGENYGIILTDSTTTSVVIATIPLFSPIAAYFFLREKIKFLNFIGIIVSLIGVILVIMTDDFSISVDPKGLLLLFGAVICAVLYTVLVVGLSSKYNIYTILAFQNIIGVLWFIPAFFLFDFKEFLNTGFKPEAFLPIILLAVFGSTICYLLFIYGVKKLGITKANIFGNSIPVFTAFFAFIILGKVFTWLNIIGIFLVLTGVSITQINKLSFKKYGNNVMPEAKLRKIYPKS